jgi:integrase
MIREMQAAGYASSSILTALRPLSRVLSHAARRGIIPVNPLTRLERGERPRAERRERRVLDPGEIGRLLAATDDRHRLLLDLTLTTGLRQGEALGLTWADVDTARAVLTIRAQLGRDGKRVRPKTEAAVREIELPGSLVTALREHKAASRFSQPGDFVFASTTGGPMHYRNVARRGLEERSSEPDWRASRSSAGTTSGTRPSPP